MSSAPPSLLLRGGTLLIHDDSNHVVPTLSDMLIEGSIITKIAPDIEAPGPSTRTIDLTGKIVGPGYISTHHHTWQTALRGRFADKTLLEYLPCGNNLSVKYSVADLFFGQLAGALECIDGGITAIVDHSHCNPTPEHPHAAIQALSTAGLRAVYCLCPTTTTASANPPTVQADYFSPSFITAFRSLAAKAPYADGRVTIGAVMDNYFAPAETMQKTYAALRGDNDPSNPRAKLITVHALAGPIVGVKMPSTLQILDTHNLLGPDILLSHACQPKATDGALYASSGAFVSSTPNTEFQMGEFPVGIRSDHYHNASLGVDTSAWGVGSMPEQMRMLLQGARLTRGGDLAHGRGSEQGGVYGHVGKSLWSRRVGITCEEVYNLGTIGGAKAMGMEGEIGRLQEGFEADFVVYDTDTPRMLAVSLEDPVAAVVMFSCPGDVSMVVVGGVVRKENGKLLDVVVAEAETLKGEGVQENGQDLLVAGTKLGWRDVTERLLQSRKDLLERIEGLDFKGAEELIMENFQLDKGALLEAQTE